MNPDSENEQNSAAPTKDEGENLGSRFNSKRIMELAIGAATTISVALWILAGLFAYRHHESALIWSTFFAIVFLFLAFFLNWQKRAWDTKEGVQTDEPSIKIDVGGTLHAQDPLFMRFILTNQSRNSIYSVDVKGEAWNPNPQNNVFMMNVADVDFIKELPPGNRFSLNPSFLVPMIAGSGEPHPKTVILQFRMTFTYSKDKRSAAFRFNAERRDDGSYMWLPMDPAIDIDEVIRRDKAHFEQLSANRPWVGVKEAGLRKPVTAGEPAAVILKFNNTGKTPSNKTITKVWVTVTDKTDPTTFPRPEVSEFSNGVIAPGDHPWTEIETPRTFPQEHIDLLLKKTIRFYVYGIITYDDPSGTVHGQTEFCFYNLPGTIYFSEYEKGNYAK